MAKSRNGSANRRGSRRGGHNYGHQLLDDALSIGGALVRSQKTYGAERLQSFADATRDYGQSLANIPSAQSYVNLAAESVEALADYIVETDLEEMVSDASAFARRQPLATMLIAVSLGLIATLAVRNQGFGRTSSARRIAATPTPKRTSRTRTTKASKRKSPVHSNGAGHSAANA